GGDAFSVAEAASQRADLDAGSQRSLQGRRQAGGAPRPPSGGSLVPAAKPVGGAGGDVGAQALGVAHRRALPSSGAGGANRGHGGREHARLTGRGGSHAPTDAAERARRARPWGAAGAAGGDL